MSEINHFAELAAINVSEYVEKKNNLSYLSWPFAIEQLMRKDPMANWEFHEPQRFGETMMVSCTVTAFGKPITMHLPVMDHRNNAIKNPDAFAVNKNMMRCLVKAIACHGLGLYIYSGEDLPSDEDGNRVSAPKKAAPKPDVWATEPAKPVATDVLAKKDLPKKTIEGNGGNWNIKISDEHDGNGWAAAAVQGAEMALEMAQTADDVIEIFKTNRNIFEKLQQDNPSLHSSLMDKFKTTKESFK